MAGVRLDVTPKIYIALTDDWELRGDGSGDIEKIQFEPMRRLVDLYDKYGARGTFNAEMMQQLAFRKHQDRHPELGALADRWDESVSGAHGRGHDIQLHIHSQWAKAEYQSGRWRLNGDWSILNFEPDEALAMLLAGKEYLEKLLKPVDPEYRCVAFRAGSLAIAPSPHMLELLVQLGIELDTSIVGGLRVDTRNLQLDYTSCEESFLPFYPRMEDARRVSEKREKIVCVPIHHFYGSRHEVFKQVLSIGWDRTTRKFKKSNGVAQLDSYAQQEWASVGRSSKFATIYDKAIKPCLNGKHLTSDFSRLSHSFVDEMFDAIQTSAASTGLEKVPVVLTNHSKYMEDYSPIESFLKRASRDESIEFVTLSALAEKLKSGEFQIRLTGQ
jgi:hypothetical protein